MSKLLTWTPYIKYTSFWCKTDATDWSPYYKLLYLNLHNPIYTVFHATLYPIRSFTINWMKSGISAGRPDLDGAEPGNTRQKRRKRCCKWSFSVSSWSFRRCRSAICWRTSYNFWSDGCCRQLIVTAPSVDGLGCTEAVSSWPSSQNCRLFSLILLIVLFTLHELPSCLALFWPLGVGYRTKSQILRSQM